MTNCYRAFAITSGISRHLAICTHAAQYLNFNKVAKVSHLGDIIGVIVGLIESATAMGKLKGPWS